MIYQNHLGIRMTIDMKKPVGSRITDLKVRCDPTIATCIDSIEINDAVYENILPDKEYSVVGTTYLYNAGDGFKTLKQSYRDRIQGKYFKSYFNEVNLLPIIQLPIISKSVLI